MPTFSYRACTDDGQVIRGLVEAISREAAEGELRRQGHTPLKVRAAHPQFEKWFERLEFAFAGGRESCILFTRQLRSLLIAGIPIVKALDVILKQTDSKLFKRVLVQMLKDIETGSEFSGALARFPKVFPEIYVNTVKAGEVGGILAEVLERLASYLEYEMKVKREIKSALRYPVIVVSSLLLASFFFSLFVIPKFAQIFSTLKINLPLPTRIVFKVGTFLGAHVLSVLMVLFLIGSSLIFYVRTEKGRKGWDRWKLKIPIFGDIVHKTLLLRFSWMLRMMYQSGLPIVRALHIVGGTLQNRVFEKELQEASLKVEGGEPLSGYLATSSYFPPMVTYMIATGEKSGSLDQMLDEVSRHYEMELNYKIRNIMVLIEPVVTLFLGVGVLIFTLAVFLPIWSLIEIAKRH
ncbi:MAG: type II secretion system F family protein [Chlamydiae bacterium]|nr:type II secretion system F family protein [Chlamydiota bacterium]MBI3266593.1 type II secretion system F family protein [Chlamydiota bacterium]